MVDSLFLDAYPDTPLKYTYQKVLLDRRGKIQDCLLIYASRAFEEIAGQNAKGLSGNRFKTIYSGAETDCNDWISLCGGAALTGLAQETIRYVGVLDSWYRITVFSPKPGYSVMMLGDVKPRMADKSIGCSAYPEADFNDNIISSLLSLLYEKSPESKEHTQRVQYYCRALSEELCFSQKAAASLSLLAMVHDIGKVGVRLNILQKPNPLTPAEWNELQRHSEMGFRIAKGIPELSDTAEYILAHHERWDGTGYPRGLKQESIPLVCRILSVADAYDAMTNDRVYRKALSHGAAVTELRKNAGTQFDPEIVSLYIGLLAQRSGTSLFRPGMAASPCAAAQ